MGAAASGGSVNSSGAGAGRPDDLLGTPKGGQAVTNSDGSTTTTLSYADGSTISMTTPPSGGAGSGPGGFLARMIQQQAQMFASSPGQSVAMSV